MMFENGDIGNAVTVDLDTYFYYFVRPSEEVPTDERPGISLSLMQERINRMYEYTGYRPTVMEYRRSSNDHVHLRLVFENPVSVLDGFMIRAWMLDDQTRLSLDLARYLKTRSLHEMNRCFDEKATVDGIKRAGPWIPMGWSVAQYHRHSSLFDDWQAYLARWNTETHQKKLQV